MKAVRRRVPNKEKIEVYEEDVEDGEDQSDDDRQVRAWGEKVPLKIETDGNRPLVSEDFLNSKSREY